MKDFRDFDAVAATWDEQPRRVKLAGDIAAAIRDRVPISVEWNAMDFGCGTGLLTLQLSPYVHRIIGVDSSHGMLANLLAKLPMLGITNVETMYRGHDSSTFPAGPFDLITSAMTLHHIPEIIPLLTSLRTLLQPSGWIALADLEAEDGSFHEDTTGIFHHGFEREQMTTALIASGFTDISISTATSVGKETRTYPVFLAVAKAA